MFYFCCFLTLSLFLISLSLFYLIAWACSLVFSCWEWHPVNSWGHLRMHSFSCSITIWETGKQIQSSEGLARFLVRKCFYQLICQGLQSPIKLRLLAVSHQWHFSLPLPDRWAYLSSWLPTASLGRYAPMSVTYMLTIASWVRIWWLCAFNLNDTLCPIVQACIHFYPLCCLIFSLYQ